MVFAFALHVSKFVPLMRQGTTGKDVWRGIAPVILAMFVFLNGLASIRLAAEHAALPRFLKSPLICLNADAAVSLAGAGDINPDQPLASAVHCQECLASAFLILGGALQACAAQRIAFLALVPQDIAALARMNFDPLPPPTGPPHA